MTNSGIKLCTFWVFLYAYKLLINSKPEALGSVCLWL